MNTHICNMKCVGYLGEAISGSWALAANSLCLNFGVCLLAVWSWPHHLHSLSFSILSGPPVCWVLCFMSINVSRLFSSCLTVEREVRINNPRQLTQHHTANRGAQSFRIFPCQGEGGLARALPIHHGVYARSRTLIPSWFAHLWRGREWIAKTIWKMLSLAERA